MDDPMDGLIIDPIRNSIDRVSALSPWVDGWLQGIRHVPSPNFNPRPPGQVADLALIHSISLPPGVYGGDAIERLFTNALDWNAHPYFERIRGLQVSSHFLLRRDGELIQFVGIDDRAWHAGRSSWRGRDGCNDFSVGIELEGLEGETFEAVQYQVLHGLLEQLRTRLSLTAVAGHEHVAPGRKIDPGPGFDWPSMVSKLGWPREYFPDSVLRLVDARGAAAAVDAFPPMGDSSSPANTPG
ncbi:MAG: anhydro-N-acetylmuramyl-tripeptide amidase [Rhizobacter sp.]|nr:anhydro-N-acetylmuramyl-tripeptide amidase [Rhizobacter sp.]